jgi:GTP-binding protein
MTPENPPATPNPPEEEEKDSQSIAAETPAPRAGNAVKKPRGRVAIVGRPNVGKSELFNRLAGRRVSIVHDQPGVTRDRISTVCTVGNHPFEVIDTGGIGANLIDGFADQVRAEADIAIESADLILFLVDGREGITSIDEELAGILHHGNAPVMLVVNKIDTEKSDPLAAEFTALGFANLIAISAAHGRNFAQLVERAERELGRRASAANDEDDSISAEEIDYRDSIKLAIVGRPNVGKSSLINAILKDERTIVSDVAGTTRDAVDVPYQRDGVNYTLIDTAGIRRRTKRDSSVEVFSVMRAERSIRRADLCLLVIDCSTGAVAQERRIARMILDAQKPCIVLLNKFDLYHPDARFQDRVDGLKEDIGPDLFFLHYAPMVAISAKKRDYLGKIFKAIDEVRDRAAEPLSTGILNRLLSEAILTNPPPVRRSKRLKLLYATQKRDDQPRPIPVPEYLLFVNYANLLTRTYERYLENQIRDKEPLTGLPIIFTIKSRRGEGGSNAPSAGARIAGKGKKKSAKSKRASAERSRFSRPDRPDKRRGGSRRAPSKKRR